MEPLQDAETLPDLVARERRSDDPALLVDGPRRQRYTYHRLCTTAWQTGNFLRHLGIRDGATVAIAADRAAQPVLALFGTALLGGIALFDPPRSVDARAVVAPVETVGEYDLPPGGQRAGYRGDSEDPNTYHFEEELWSENPTTVPREYDPDAAVLSDGDREYSHRTLLDAARETVDHYGIESNDVVATREPLADPEVLVAGLLAPLLAGATVALDEDATTTEPILDEAAAADDPTLEESAAEPVPTMIAGDDEDSDIAIPEL